MERRCAIDFKMSIALLMYYICLYFFPPQADMDPRHPPGTVVTNKDTARPLVVTPHNSPQHPRPGLVQTSGSGSW